MDSCPPTDPAEPYPAACMNGTCVCPPTPDGTDQHHASEPGPFAGIPVVLDPTLPPDTVLLRGRTDTYVRLDRGDR